MKFVYIILVLEVLKETYSDGYHLVWILWTESEEAFYVDETTKRIHFCVYLQCCVYVRIYTYTYICLYFHSSLFVFVFLFVQLFSHGYHRFSSLRVIERLVRRKVKQSPGL